MTKTDMIIACKSRGCIFPKIIFHCPVIPPSIVDVLRRYGDVSIYRYTRTLVKVKSLEMEMLTVIGGTRLQVFFKSRKLVESIEKELSRDLHDLFLSTELK